DLRQRLEDHVDQTHDRFGIAADRLRRLDRQDRALVDAELDRLEHAGIGRHVAEDVLQGNITGRDGGRARDVDRAGAGGRGPREVHDHAVAGNGQVEGDLERLVPDAV